MDTLLRYYLSQLDIRSLANTTIRYVRVAMSGCVQLRYNLSENISYWTTCTLIQPCSYSVFNRHTWPEGEGVRPNPTNLPWIRRCDPYKSVFERTLNHRTFIHSFHSNTRLPDYCRLSSCIKYSRVFNFVRKRHKRPPSVLLWMLQFTVFAEHTEKKATVYALG